MDVSLAFSREMKVTAACNFITSGEKMRELLDKTGKKKGKRKINDHMIEQKRREICTLCRSVFWRS